MPGRAAIPSETLTSPLCSGSANLGHDLRCLAIFIWANCTCLPLKFFSIYKYKPASAKTTLTSLALSSLSYFFFFTDCTFCLVLFLVFLAPCLMFCFVDLTVCFVDLFTLLTSCLMVRLVDFTVCLIFVKILGLAEIFAVFVNPGNVASIVKIPMKMNRLANLRFTWIILSILVNWTSYFYH
jgi:hypothetical protein